MIIEFLKSQEKVPTECTQKILRLDQANLSLSVIMYSFRLINLYFRNSPTMKCTQSQTFWINSLLHFYVTSEDTEDKMGCITYVWDITLVNLRHSAHIYISYLFVSLKIICLTSNLLPFSSGIFSKSLEEHWTYSK